jgi:hypothetical protein
MGMTGYLRKAGVVVESEAAEVNGQRGRGDADGRIANVPCAGIGTTCRAVAKVAA